MKVKKVLKKIAKIAAGAAGYKIQRQPVTSSRRSSGRRVRIPEEFLNSNGSTMTRDEISALEERAVEFLSDIESGDSYESTSNRIYKALDRVKSEHLHSKGGFPGLLVGERWDIRVCLKTDDSKIHTAVCDGLSSAGFVVEDDFAIGEGNLYFESSSIDREAAYNIVRDKCGPNVVFSISSKFLGYKL